MSIRHYEAAEQHLYDPEGSIDKRQDVKRLWWCVLLRDRIMALSSRRPLKLSPTNTDFKQACLDEEDFKEEIQGSLVYDPNAKITLAHFANILCQLGLILNGLLDLLYSERPWENINTPSQLCYERLLQQEARLDEWYLMASTELDTQSDAPAHNESLLLFPKMIYIYYRYVGHHLYLSCQHSLTLQENGESILVR